jgi:hypothetical protein
MGWMTAVRFPAEIRDFFLLHRVQTGPGTSPTSYPMGSVDLITERKTTGE